jgi:hypothetical protein
MLGLLWAALQLSSHGFLWLARTSWCKLRCRTRPANNFRISKSLQSVISGLCASNFQHNPLLAELLHIAIHRYIQYTNKCICMYINIQWKNPTQFMHTCIHCMRSRRYMFDQMIRSNTSSICIHKQLSNCWMIFDFDIQTDVWLSLDDHMISICNMLIDWFWEVGPHLFCCEWGSFPLNRL